MKQGLFLLLLLCSALCYAQSSKHDKVYLNNGSELEVKVTKVTASNIEFQYPGETVQNVEDVANIRTIVYGSGRVQQFNTTAAASASAANPATDAPVATYRPVERNALAILPVVFYDKNTGVMMADKSKLAQSRIYDFFEDAPARIAPLKLQDTRNTNAWLRKSDINFEHLDETPIEELGKILGAEYLILSKVNVEERANVTASQSTYGSTKREGNKTSGGVVSTSTSNENKTYNYNVVLEIYKGNQKIYNETRKPFLNMEDSWKDAMEYMLKRCPIYRKS